MNQIKNIENFRAMSLNDYNENIPLNLSNQEFTLFFLNVNDDIKKVIYETLNEMEVKNAKITIDDKGALDVVFKSRLQTAIMRSAKSKEFNWN